MKKWITKNYLRIGQRREGLSLQFSLPTPQFRIIRLSLVEASPNSLSLRHQS